MSTVSGQNEATNLLNSMPFKRIWGPKVAIAIFPGYAAILPSPSKGVKDGQGEDRPNHSFVASDFQAVQAI